MTQFKDYDPRLSPITIHVKSMASPQEYFAAKAGDVRHEYLDGVHVLYRHEDIVKINRHPAVLGMGAAPKRMFATGSPLIPLEVDGEEHRKWRRVLDPMFSPKKMAELGESVRALAGELLDQFAADGFAELHDAFCVPLPSLTFLRLVGAPVSDLDFFISFKDGVLHPEGETLEEMNVNMLEAGTKLLQYFVTFLAERRQDLEGRNDVISNLIRTEVDGEPVTDDLLLRILFLFMFAGLDTVTASLSCVFAWLGQHPEERDRLVADPSLIPAATEEILRYESPVPSGLRYPCEDIDLGDGLIVKAGETIHTLWSAANVDPTFHEDPLRVDFDRGRTNHIVFASGAHRCLGSHLARLEIRIAVEELLARAPDFTTDPKELRFDNVSVRVANHLPIKFTPKTAGV
ncbi:MULTISPECIES: cytochrome P450 [Mycobacterium]|uniref:Cytochrome P450 n=1 Tax=Mycobacterium paraseoulense TaxID=590652 RepID=A0A1X0IEX1_9MYCO|nr:MULTISPECIES: cytochrome P450 [Mycobacterium]MCV7393836.1 cytochrome P450 [Mycobacterium paraseoulense]OBH11796.1 cytochrome [Mycobacterium sp. E3247]OBH37711.1 cytochrome [Mycobacterium sp. E342]ORB45435.1 cytochrome P450 [Mycobacterium paraseoulense]BBZ70543.1 hypothetical protein MPRS_16360 [Mycobacterium paraseoulense]